MAGATTYLDFDVAISRRGDNLDVRVLDSPAGETGSVLSPLPDRFLTAALETQGSRALRPVHARADGTDPTAVGIALFDALFHGPVLLLFGESRHRAAQAGAGLRLMLRFDGGVDELPWELLHDPQTGRFLALDPTTPVIRCTETASKDLVAPVDDRLRILVAVSSPPGVSPVDAVAERAALTALLEPLTLGSAVSLDVLEDASLEGIRSVLAEREVHVFHYIGHGSSTAEGKSAVVLTDAAGALSVRSADDLALVLGAAPALRLAVLNSCHGSLSSPTDPFAGAGATLVRAGIPAVIAMRATITDDAAIAFASGLYRELARGASIERAVTNARASLAAADSPAAREWPTVALHLGSSLAAGLTASPLPRLDEDVEFTVARPERLRAEEWAAMLVFAHHGKEFLGDDGRVVDHTSQVRQRIASFYGGAKDVQTTSEESSMALPRGAELVVVPDFPSGVECDPPVAGIVWRGDIAETRFLLRPRLYTAGETVPGWVRVFCGPIVVAESRVEFAVVTAALAPDDAPRRESIQRYRHIFPCFASEDAEVVDGIVAVAEALGDRYTERVVTAQREGAPTGWLLDLITEADAFQLFWSRRSMVSTTCRQQWERALSTAREGFILPLYWEDPFPRQAGLPPPALEALPFVRVPWTRPEPAPVAPPPLAVEESRTPPPQLPPPGSSPTRSAPPSRRRRAGAAAALLVTSIVSALVAVGLFAVGPMAGDVPSIGGSRRNVVPIVVAAAIALVALGIAFVLRARRKR